MTRKIRFKKPMEEKTKRQENQGIREERLGRLEKLEKSELIKYRTRARTL
jgi:hypothetical protein